MFEILRGVFIFHLTWSVLPHYLVKHKVRNLCSTFSTWQNFVHQFEWQWKIIY